MSAGRFTLKMRVSRVFVPESVPLRVYVVMCSSDRLVGPAGAVVVASRDKSPGAAPEPVTADGSGVVLPMSGRMRTVTFRRYRICESCGGPGDAVPGPDGA